MTTFNNTPPLSNFTIYRGDTFVKTSRIKQRSTRQLQDLICITKGVARYTADFTVPADPFPDF